MFINFFIKLLSVFPLACVGVYDENCSKSKSYAKHGNWSVLTVPGTEERTYEALLRKGRAVYCNWTPLSAEAVSAVALKISRCVYRSYFRIGNKSSIAIWGSWPCKAPCFLAFVPESYARIVMKEAREFVLIELFKSLMLNKLCCGASLLSPRKQIRQHFSLSLPLLIINQWFYKHELYFQ